MYCHGTKFLLYIFRTLAVLPFPQTVIKGLLQRHKPEVVVDGKWAEIVGNESNPGFVDGVSIPHLTPGSRLTKHILTLNTNRTN